MLYKWDNLTTVKLEALWTNNTVEMLFVWTFQQSSALTASIKAKVFQTHLILARKMQYFQFTVELRLFLKGYYNTEYSFPVPANAAKDAS